ncbi:MAG: hypothetical protein GX111_04330 [Clostridiales bacterium]|nr:hypothetical protein [Clostridiales bacterium]
MIGGGVGIVAGFIAFFLLKQFVFVLASGKRASVFLGIAQPLFLAICLMLCALFMPGQLQWAGAGISGTLITGTLVSTAHSLRRLRRAKCPDKPLRNI